MDDDQHETGRAVLAVRTATPDEMAEMATIRDEPVPIVDLAPEAEAALRDWFPPSRRLGSWRDEPKAPYEPHTKYKPEYVQRAADMCLFGATDEELAEELGVKRLTILRWRARHPEFNAALKVNKDRADERVEDSLYRRALGYNLRTEKLFAHQGVVTRAETIEHVPAETKAAIFWLKNRRPKEWRDVQEITGANGAALIPQDSASRMELARYVMFVMQRGARASEELVEENGVWTANR